MRFADQVVLVTGSARGIGRTAAEAFAREGAAVIVVDTNEPGARAAADAIIAAGGRARAVQANVASAPDAERVVSEARAAFGRIDVLVNNAGITRDATLLKMTDEQFSQVIDVNLRGVFTMTRAVAPVMIEAGYGRIVNTSSVVALYGNFGQSNYVATKSGVIGMTKVWARELGRKGITVNAVAPGFIATDMVATVPEKVLASIKERTPLQRLGEPKEIAAAYLFLASKDASYVNGAVLSVDGGMVW